MAVVAVVAAWAKGLARCGRAVLGDMLAGRTSRPCLLPLASVWGANHVCFLRTQQGTHIDSNSLTDVSSGAEVRNSVKVLLPFETAEHETGTSSKKHRGEPGTQNMGRALRETGLQVSKYMYPSTVVMRTVAPGWVVVRVQMLIRLRFA